MAMIQRTIEVIPTHQEIKSAAVELPPVDKLHLINLFCPSITDKDLKEICDFMSGDRNAPCKEWIDVADNLVKLGNRMRTIGSFSKD